MDIINLTYFITRFLITAFFKTPYCNTKRTYQLGVVECGENNRR